MYFIYFQQDQNNKKEVEEKKLLIEKIEKLIKL